MFELTCVKQCFKGGRIRFKDDTMQVESEAVAKTMEKAGNWKITSAPEKAEKKSKAKDAAPAKDDKVQDPLAS